MSNWGNSSMLIPTQPPADPRHPLVALLRLLNDVAIFHHRHGAKLVDPERPPIKTVPGLPKQRRAARVQPDRNRGGEQDRRQDDQTEQRQNNVDPALDRLLRRRQRRALKLDRNRIADVGARALKQLRERSERNQRHGQRQHPEPPRQPPHVRHVLGIDEQHDLFNIGRAAERNDALDDLVGARSAVRHVEVGHRVIAVASQIVGELGRNASPRTSG